MKHTLENCIDTKGQRVVSLTRLAEVLGVEPLTDKQVAELVDNRKAPQFKMLKLEKPE